MNKTKKVLVFGTFDGIHEGHIHFLNEAKKLAGEDGGLYVSVASDESIISRKQHQPERKAPARLRDVKELKIAEGVAIGDKILGNWSEIKKVKPDIIALGYDQKGLKAALIKNKRNLVKEIGKNFVIKIISSYKGETLHSSIINNKSCTFCTIPEIKKRTIVENKLAFAFPTNIPIVPGHLLISPKRCVAKFEDMTKTEIEAVFLLAKKLQTSLKKSFSATGFNFAWNEGELVGQSVPHFHLHVLPRKEGDTGIVRYDPRKFLYRPGSREKTPENELLAVVKLIKNNLK